MYTGPVVIATQAIRKRWLRSMSDEVAKILHDRCTPNASGAVPLELGKDAVLMMHMSDATRFQPIGAGGVIVRLDLHHDIDFDESDDDAVEEALEVDFSTIKESAWKKTKAVLDVGEAPILFVTAAAIDDREEDLARWAEMPLKKGIYEVDLALVRQDERDLELLRFRPKGKKLDMSKAPRKAPEAKSKSELELAPAVARLAKTMPWVGTDGGPVVVLRSDQAKKWKGTLHYESVMDEGFGRMKVDGMDVLVLPLPHLTGFCRLGIGGMFVRCQYGEPDACLAVALAADPKAWKRMDKLELKTRDVALLSAADNGTKAKRCELSPGSYAIELLSKASAVVDGEEAAVMSCVRFRRL